MNFNQDTHPAKPIYHLVPFQEEIDSALMKNQHHNKLSIIQTEVIKDINDAVDTIRERRPEDQKVVSRVLDDIENIIDGIEY